MRGEDTRRGHALPRGHHPWDDGVGWPRDGARGTRSDADATRRPRRGWRSSGAVAGGLVHEIRNPLSTMNVTLQLLQEDWDGAGRGRAAPQRTVRRIDSLRGGGEPPGGDPRRLPALRGHPAPRTSATSDLNRVLEEVMAFITPGVRAGGVDARLLPGHAPPADGAGRAPREAGRAEPAAQRASRPWRRGRADAGGSGAAARAPADRAHAPGGRRWRAWT